MATENLYRTREKAAAISDDLSRWLDIAKRFDRLAAQPPQGPIWRVERVKPKKKPR